MQRNNLVLFFTALAVCALGVQPSRAVWNMNVNFSGSFTASQQTAIGQAETLWESNITGYLPGISLTSINVNVQAVAIDGVGGTLGQAFFPNTTVQGGFRLSTGGTFQLDIADIAGLENTGRLDDVVAHEMGHILGIGTLWTNNHVYTNGTGQYTGPLGVAAYNAEFGQSGTFIPVELGGGSGTVDKHWNEVNNGAGPTFITDSLGRDFRDELMTGWLNPNPFLSNTTIQSLGDIGFTVVPEPSSLAIALTAIALLTVARRRRRLSSLLAAG